MWAMWLPCVYTLGLWPKCTHLTAAGQCASCFSAKVERAEFRCAYMRFLVFLGLAVVGTCKRIAIASASAGWPVLQLDC